MLTKEEAVELMATLEKDKATVKGNEALRDVKKKILDLQEQCPHNFAFYETGDAHFYETGYLECRICKKYIPYYN